jgi:hypothetical protein
MGILRLFLVASFMVVGGLSASGTASAAVFNVNSTGQQQDAVPGDGACSTAEGTCSLRAALEETNALLGADEINVPAGDYPVTTWMPTISQTLVLRGTQGAALTRLDSGGTGQRWSISGGGVVEIEGLTFTGVDGTGSAVAVNGPDTTFRDVAIEGNRTTLAHGAGLRIQTAQVTMIRSAVTDNVVDRAIGQAFGGGIALIAGSLTAVATTVARNSVKNADSSAWGGGIFSGGQLIMRHVTLSGNTVQSASAANYGGNLFVSTGSQASVRDSIVINGSTGSGQSRNCGISSGAILTVSGNNIYQQLGNLSCAFPEGTVVDTSTATTELADHGGTGLTLVPLAPSSAFDGAAGCPDGGRDQRGVKAPTGAACDIGAAELGADLRVQLTAAPGPVAPGAAVFHTAVLSNAGLDTATATKLALTPASGLSILSVSGGSCTSAGKCSFGTLAPGMSRTVTFSTKAPARGRLLTRASGSALVPDPSPRNATARAATKVLGPPVISKLRAVGKLRSGTRGRIGLRLSRAATVRIAVSSLKTGKRVGVLTAKRKTGAATINFPPSLGGRKLTPGLYRLSATAASGGLRSKTARATVKVLKGSAR